jgi:hypothetical protein
MAPGLISSTVHRAGPNGEDNYSRGETTIKNEATEFHIYEMNWATYWQQIVPFYAISWNLMQSMNY